MSLPRYPKYKDSGVEWLGEVPSQWRVVPIKRVASIRYGIGEPPIYREEGVPLIRATNVSKGELHRNGLVLIDPQDLPANRIVWLSPGDIIVVRSGAYTGDSAIIPADFGEAIAGFDMVLSCHSVNPDFLQFALLSDYLKNAQIDLERMRAAQPHLNAEELGSSVVVLPSIDEQETIVATLRPLLAEIDTLIQEQRRLIELLKEKRQAVISHAVTKGLNPNAPMKPSGIDWLGDIPAHWAIKRLKYVSPRVTVGIVVEPSKHYRDEGIPALRSLNVKPGSISSDELVFISEESNELLSKSKLRAGDLVVVRSGQPGTTAVVPPEFDGCNCIDLIIIHKPNDGSEAFLCWYLASDHAQRQFTEGSGGAIQQHFNITTAMNLIVTVPPLDEKTEMASFLSSETSRIDGLISDAYRAIDLLQERRSALISAAVTGKIDVRGLAGTEAA